MKNKKFLVTVSQQLEVECPREVLEVVVGHHHPFLSTRNRSRDHVSGEFYNYTIKSRAAGQHILSFKEVDNPLSCPFCGSGDTEYVSDDEDGAIYCRDCKTYGPTGFSKSNAILLWNKRV